ncbi:hypothetical protein ACFFU1_14035 [Algibacter miyuki]|uniref:Uncharacterized protein n=1 Tax=Algibacter miyuki TaxID=1306933 RepID=A0ABV5H2B1_9FLAO|nr:hypothetical protein [Algibacter miyuki]MDN3664428.1 hypothetical protein [Algibacter miyuki]
MKKYFLMLTLCVSFFCVQSQVGIGTTSPDDSSILDIESDSKGILIPRLTTAERNSIPLPATGLLVFNITTSRFEFNSGSVGTPLWNPINSNATVSTDPGNLLGSGTDSGAFIGTTTYIGKFIITNTGIQTINGIPFEPSSIKFSAYANVETEDLDADNGVSDNNTGFQNSFGAMQGYATNYGGIINQQVIFNGGSGNSINDISRYASSSRAIGIRYGNQNGDKLGLTAAEVTSFNADGFTINVTDKLENIIVIYEAHR